MWLDRAIMASRTRSQQAQLVNRLFHELVGKGLGSHNENGVAKGGGYQGSDVFCSRLIATCHGD